MLVPARSLLTLAIFAVAPTLAGQQAPDHCRGSEPDRPSADLYCLELTTAPVAPRGVSGYVILDLAPGPFTLPVTRDGVIRYRPRAVLSGLPAPSTVDSSATVYVAWETTPLFTHWRNVGAVGNGEHLLDEVALDQFVIVISAERDSLVKERTGPMLLRGVSPSSRLVPPDFLEFATGIAGMSSADVAMLEHTHHNTDPDSLGWTTVPMPEGFEMLPAEMALRPDVNARQLRATSSVPEGRGSEVVQLADGDTLRLSAGLVRKQLHGREHLMLAFNGQMPGPVIWVAGGTSITVRFENNLDQPSTIHWHGLRLDASMDGVPGLSQEPVPPGGVFWYTVRFPDSGVYWYHPHVREEEQQDLGLSGNIVVRGMPGLEPVSHEQLLLLDDILINDRGLVPHGDEAATHALMGRFGNVLLVNAEPSWHGTVGPSRTMRLWYTNAANTRTFNLSIANATMKLVATDLGAFNSPDTVESVVIAPAERYAVDVTFQGDGPWQLVNRVRSIDHLFGRFVPTEDTLGTVELAADFEGQNLSTALPGEAVGPENINLRMEPPTEPEIPDMVLEFGLRTRDLPYVTSRMMLLDSTYFHPVEWNGTMPMMNWATTTRQAAWFVRDAATGLENHEARFTVPLGATRHIRLVNLRGSLHAMQHPIHIHGQRFRVLAVNGIEWPDQPYKDTVLLPAGATVDIMVEFTNPGAWMLHCHIAEHMAAGMMTIFEVQQ